MVRQRVSTVVSRQENLRKGRERGLASTRTDSIDVIVTTENIFYCCDDIFNYYPATGSV